MSTLPAGEKPAPHEVYDRIAIKDLFLDPENPRLAEYGIDSNASQFDLIKTLWERMAVEELAMSIALNGYFEHEPLFVQTDSQDRSIVIEGNRRLAAVKILLDTDLRKKLKANDLPTINDKRKRELQSLPVITTTKKEVWRYLGFKHVNGPSQWGSYAKAQYVAKVHHEYKIPLADIAKQIGDYNYTVERMYRGLMVVEQAEKEGVFDRKSVAKKDFYFNYLYTGLDYPGITKFLGLDPEEFDKREPIPKKKVKNLGEVLEWLYGNKHQDKPSLIKSQNETVAPLPVTSYPLLS